MTVSLVPRAAPGAIDLLSSGSNDKKKRKLALVGQKFRADIRPALNRTYPRGLMGPKGILYRLPGNQQRR